MDWIVALIFSVAAAVVPTLVYVFIFYWADRYEREPRFLLAVAFLWGAVPAIIVSLISQIVLGIPLGDPNDGLANNLAMGVLIAPITEEIFKAAALYLIYRWRRHEFDGVLDGLLYGALVGFGFAMTENFLYFVGAYGEGGFGELTVVVILRAVIFGLNHAFYTGLIGIGFGLARTTPRPAMRKVWPILGLLAGILVHAIHNLSVSITEIFPFSFLVSLLLAGSGLLLIFLVILLSWQHERKIIRTELAGELGVVLSADELETLLGKWRQPISRKAPGTQRRQQLAQLALRKHRLRRVGTAREPHLTAEIDRLRQALSQLA
ncbi:MAG: PrsW family intramembrane metalloprotease [Litorilinea sp.]